MGRVYLNADNKLVVETDNGTIKADGTTRAEIRSGEEYTISADDVAVLFNIVNGMTVVFESHKFNSFLLGNLTQESIEILPGNDFGETLEDITKLQDKIREENKKLKDTISKYNEDKKIFWRPIKIE